MGSGILHSPTRKNGPISGEPAALAGHDVSPDRITSIDLIFLQQLLESRMVSQRIPARVEA